MRIILLSGTPALSRPVELFSQIRIIDRSIFPAFRSFASRYCDGKQGKFNYEAKGCTNSTELAIILSNTIMLRLFILLLHFISHYPMINLFFYLY